MLAAAAAWDGLAAELSAAAASYDAQVSGLAGDAWLGPASASMAAAAAPYQAWMTTTAERTKQAADQARAAAAAYEAAFAAHVPPPVIAENRALLMSLVATNIFGQNTPAIATTEAHYAEMWAQDATAMYGYAGESAVASTLPPFTAPAQNTNPAGVGAQAAAVGQATETVAAASSSTTLSQLIASVPNALQGLASGGSFVPTTGLTNLMNGSMGSSLGFSTDLMNFASGQTFVASGVLFLVEPFLSGPIAGGAASSVGWYGPEMGSSGAAGLWGGGAVGGPSLSSTGVSAVLSRAASVGGLSVPQTWAAAAPAITPAATVSPQPTLIASPEAEIPGLGAGYGEMLPGSLMAAAAGGGGAAAGGWAAQRGGRPTQPGDRTPIRYGSRPTVIPQTAREAGPDEGMHGQANWPAQCAQGDHETLSEKVRDEINDLRKQIAGLALERDVLMRSLALWANEAKG